MQDKGTLLLSAKQDKSGVPLSYVSQARQKQRPPVLHSQARQKQRPPVLYKEMYVMWKQYSENDFFENE